MANQKAAVLPVRRVRKRLLLREGFLHHVFAHDVVQASDGMKRRLHAVELEMGDRLERGDDIVQIDRHPGDFVIVKPDVRICGDIAHVFFRSGVVP